MNRLPFLLLLALAAYAQQQERVAVINTIDDGDSIGVHELIYLTDRLREIATNDLPKQRYSVMTMESIVAFLGSQERAEKECREASCLAELGRKVSADYVAQARIGRFNNSLTIKTELYGSRNGNLIGSFTGRSKDINGLLAIIDENSPILFKKLPGTGGIGSVQTAGGDYEFEGGKRYLVHLNTEPSGAVLSFNGLPIASCTKTPCKAELREGNIRIIAALEQYETADTTISVNRNNQSIVITLKPNFGILDIKPAYIDGIGDYIPWNLSINDKPYSLGETRLSPKEYTVKLSHECYEDISFKAGINKGKREVFNIANSMKLKKGGLDLSAEADGEPVSEPVYINGKQAGETPFSGSVPVCAKIEIGADRETVNVNIKHNAAKTYTHQMDTEEIRRKQEARRQAKLEAAREEERREAMRTAWMWGVGLGGGASLNMRNIDPVYLKPTNGQANFPSVEFYKRNLTFFRLGVNLDFGLGGIDYDAVRRRQPNVLTDSLYAIHLKLNTFARLYPVDFLFLSGGAGWDFFGAGSKDNELNDVNVMSISTPVFPVGGGICFCESSDKEEGIGIFVEGLYNIIPFKGRTAAYITINVGIKVHQIMEKEKYKGVNYENKSF